MRVLWGHGGGRQGVPAGPVSCHSSQDGRLREQVHVLVAPVKFCGRVSEDSDASVTAEAEVWQHLSGFGDKFQCPAWGVPVRALQGSGQFRYFHRRVAALQFGKQPGTDFHPGQQLQFRVPSAVSRGVLFHLDPPHQDGNVVRGVGATPTGEPHHQVHGGPTMLLAQHRSLLTYRLQSKLRLDQSIFLADQVR